MLFSCRRVAAIGGALALAACGGVSPVSPSLSVPSISRDRVVQVAGQVFRFGASVRTQPVGPGWMSQAAASQAVLYAASYDGGFINIYPANGNNQQSIGQLTSGLTSPQGLAVDSLNRLWVANTNAFNVVGFRRNATVPFKTLSDPGYYPVSVAVDSHDNVYAANVQSTSGQPGNVVEWKNGSTTITRTLTFSAFNVVVGIGVDAQDNVYVTYVPKAGAPAMVRYAPGSKTAEPVLIQNATLGDVTFDTNANLVMETGQNSLGVWAPPYNSTPVRTIPAFGNEPTFIQSEWKVCVAYANSTTPQVVCYNYKTGALVDTITAGWTSSAIPYGIAFNPPAPL